MLRKNDMIALALSWLCLLIIIAHVVFAGTSYEINWWTVDGGGAGPISGGSYAISGTIGQPDAGWMGNGSYDLATGFWTYGGPFAVYLPVVLRNP